MSWKMIGNRADSPESVPVRQESAVPAEPQATDGEPAQRPQYVSQANPDVATTAELAEPWSAKKFFFRSLTTGKNVPALIIRLPGPAAQTESYWAFSLEAPFDRCRLDYIDGKEAAVVVYRRKLHMIDLFVTRAGHDAAHPDTAPAAHATPRRPRSCR